MNQVQLLEGSSLFASDSDVVQLSASNFNADVYGSSQMWMVDFYLTWCGRCQRFAPEYSALATNIKGLNSTVLVML